MARPYAARVRPYVARAALPIVVAAGAIAALTGCGGGTQTVSASSSPPPASTAGTTSSTNTGTGTARTPGATSSAGDHTSAQTRTGSGPAFAEQEKSSGETNGGEGQAAAEATVRGLGYTVDDLSDYRQDQTLRVLIGTGKGSNDGYDKRAFFFVDGRYIGTDAAQPSAQLSVAAQSDTEVTLAYALYKPGNPLCCPAGGQAKVRFQLNDGQLTPLDPIPPVSSTTGMSRQ